MGRPIATIPRSLRKGTHGYPYRYQFWAYDLADFAAVKAGAKQPWEIVPYAVWPFELPTPEKTVQIGGVAYDAQRQLLYVSQMYGRFRRLLCSPTRHSHAENQRPVVVDSASPTVDDGFSHTGRGGAPGAWRFDPVVRHRNRRLGAV